MYKIIGADQKEYGPISADLIRKWIAEGRANANTQARREGATTWQPLSAFPEFAMALGLSQTPPQFSAGLPTTTVAVPIEDILSGDYSLDLGACFSNAWTLITNNFGVIFAAVLIYFAIESAVGMIGVVPIIGSIISGGINLLIAGVLEGGIFYVILRAIRRQPVNVGDMFEGFRSCFVQLFLGKFVTSLLAGLCLAPALIIGAIMLLPTILRNQEPNPVQILIVFAVMFLCLIPMLILQINWMFTLPLIIDRKMEFWPAMRASWKMVTKHWFLMFALVILIGLLNAAGFILCCVGLLFTVPLGFAVRMYAYETIFSPPSQQVR